MAFDGGCACGLLRYRSELAPLESGFCHCRLCQRTTAAPVAAFASFPVRSFRYVQGEPMIYASSSHGHREFCAACGTQIAYRDAEAAVTVDVNTASLDDPAAISPQFHIWCDSQISWLHLQDDLPRYPQSKPRA